MFEVLRKLVLLHVGYSDNFPFRILYCLAGKTQTCAKSSENTAHTDDYEFGLYLLSRIFAKVKNYINYLETISV